MANRDMIGYVVKDHVTGYTGVVISQTRYLHGCDRVAIQGKVGGDGRLPEAVHADVLSVSVVEDAPRYMPPMPFPAVGG